MPARTLKDLGSRDPAKRRSAAETLSHGDERGIYPLLRALRDSNPGVQDAAMRSLVSIGGEVTAWMVLPLLREEPFLRNTAMVILKEIGAAAVPHLPPLLRDKDDDVRKFAIELIADAGATGLSGALCERLAEDDNPNVRAAAAKALGTLGCRDALVPLIAALRDAEWVRFAALESLAGMGGEAAVEPILPLLSDPSLAARFAAIEALGAIGSPRAGKALLSHLGGAERNERAVILRSLLRMGIPLPDEGVSGDLLEIFRSDEEWGDRLVALRGLVGTADDDVLRAVFDVAGSLDGTKPDEEEILLAVKDILRGCGRPESLRRLLGDPTLRFRGKTVLAEIVGELRIREAVPELADRLRSDVRDVRRAAAQALGRIGDAASREALLAALEDADGHVRRAAVAALGEIGSKEAFGPVLSLLRKETYDDVSNEAVHALAAIDPEALVAAAGTLAGHALALVEAFARERFAGGAADGAGREGRP